MKVTDPTYYYPFSLQEDVPANTTENGYLDVVDMLYSDESVSYYIGYPGTNTNYYNISLGSYNTRQKFT